MSGGWDDCEPKAEPASPPTVRTTIPVWMGSSREHVHLAPAITGGAVRVRLHSAGRALCDRTSRAPWPNLTDCPSERVTCPRCITIAGLSLAIVGATS